MASEDGLRDFASVGGFRRGQPAATERHEAVPTARGRAVEELTEEEKREAERVAKGRLQRLPPKPKRTSRYETCPSSSSASTGLPRRGSWSSGRRYNPAFGDFTPVESEFTAVLRQNRR